MVFLMEYIVIKCNLKCKIHIINSLINVPCIILFYNRYNVINHTTRANYYQRFENENQTTFNDTVSRYSGGPRS